MKPNSLTKPPAPLELLAVGEGPTDAQLELMPRAGELTQFQPFLKVLEQNEARALAMTISAEMPAEDRKKLAAEARRLRLDCFRVARLQAEKAKDSLKAEVLAFGKKVDSANGDIWDRCKSAESHLEAIENFEAIERLRIEDETRKVRASELNPFLTGACPVDLGKISAEEYASLLTDAKDLHDLRVKREREAKELAEKQAREAEEERQRVEEARRIEAARQSAEIARLQQEAIANEGLRLAAEERSRLELQALEEKNRRAQQEREKELAAERAAIEEAARQERERLLAETTAREAKEKAEREIARVAQAKLAAEKAESDQRAAALEQAESARKAAEEKQRKAEELAAKKAAAAPDVEKLRAYAAALQSVPGPALSNTSVRTEVVAAVSAALTAIRRQIAAMEGGTQ